MSLIRRPCGDQRVGSGARSASDARRLVAGGLERVGAQIERRAGGQRRALLRALVAEHAGDDRAAEGAALACRAPLDLRVNTLKADARGGRRARSPISRPEPTRWSPLGLRIKLSADAKNPAIHAEPAYLKGLIEVQDEGSQLAALLAGAKPGEQVRRSLRRRRRQDAGAGSHDGQSRARSTPPTSTSAGLRRSMTALERAGARNVQVRTPKSVGNELDRSRGPHRSRADRRALHRHRRLAAQSRRQMAGAARAPWTIALKEQAGELDRAVALVKPGGRIAYVTCSVLAEENGDQIRALPRAGTRIFPWKRPPRWRPRWASAPSCSAGRRCVVGRRAADDAAPDRHRRLLSSVILRRSA